MTLMTEKQKIMQPQTIPIFHGRFVLNFHHRIVIYLSKNCTYKNTRLFENVRERVLKRQQTAKLKKGRLLDYELENLVLVSESFMPVRQRAVCQRVKSIRQHLHVSSLTSKILFKIDLTCSYKLPKEDNVTFDVR